MKHVLGILTVYNRIEKTRQCLDSLQNNDGITWHFVITDDGSTDGTGEYFASREDVTVVKGDGSLFYSGGMRKAIERAKSFLFEKTEEKYVAPIDRNYDYVLLLNNDVVFEENTISRMISELQDKRALLAGNVCDTDGNFSYGAKQKTSSWMPHYEKVMPKDTFDEEADLANGNCLLIPADLFMKLPNIDPVYIHSLGDYDYTLAAGKIAPIYGTSYYVGVCENDHEQQGSWQDPKVPVRERIRKKETPQGNPSKQWFHFLKKNYNLITALLFLLNDYRKIILHRGAV